MFASVRNVYGGPSVLEYKTIPKPTLDSTKLLIKVNSSCVNSADWRILKGEPWLVRLAFGLFKPSLKVLGADISGTVVEKGKDCVSKIEVGDHVMGSMDATFGGFAEYALVKDDWVVKKPERLSFEGAAALPLAGLTALQGLRMVGLKGGENVLVNGAASGVGHLAVQIAKAQGAKVTAVVSNDTKLEFIKTLGADECFDASKDDVRKGDKKFDYILDCAAYEPASSFIPLLTPKGAFVLIGGNMVELAKSVFSSRIKCFVAATKKDDLQILADMAEEGKLKPKVDVTFPLEKTADAIQYLLDRKVKGKVVVKVSQ